jgi:predicted RNA-binding protein YlqC (UPF0109 family)
MKELIEYLVKGITGSSEFSVEEISDQGHTEFVIKANPSLIGLIIGKKGRTIRSIRNLVKVRATLEKKAVSVSVTEDS